MMLNNGCFCGCGLFKMQLKAAYRILNKNLTFIGEKVDYLIGDFFTFFQQSYKASDFNKFWRTIRCFRGMNHAQYRLTWPQLTAVLLWLKGELRRSMF